MLSRLLRPFKGGREAQIDGSNEPSPGPSRHDYVRLRHATADFTEADDDDDEDSNNDGLGPFGNPGRAEDDDAGLPRSSSVLPLFSASHLGENALQAQGNVWGWFADRPFFC